MSRRRVAPALPAALGAAAALGALATLGLTWVSRTVDGPLGSAGEPQVEQLVGRDVAPVVAALVPGATAAVVLALLLTGWWRALALVVGALAALGAAAAAVSVLLTGQPPGASVTSVPLLAALACLVAGGSALTGAVLAAGTALDARRAADVDPPGPTRDDDADGTPTAAGGTAPTAGTTAQAEPGQDDLWRALDAGRDPT